MAKLYNFFKSFAVDVSVDFQKFSAYCLMLLYAFLQGALSILWGCNTLCKNPTCCFTNYSFSSFNRTFPNFSM